MERKTKRGLQLAAIWFSGLMLVIAIVVVAIGSRIVSGVQNQTPASDTNAQAVLTNGQSALVDYSGWFGLIGLVVAGTIILALLIEGLVRGASGGGGRA